MKKIYFDRRMCEQLGIDYGGTGDALKITPHQIINLKWGGYDHDHMNFFRSIGMNTCLHLEHVRYGWMRVL